MHRLGARLVGLVALWAVLVGPARAAQPVLSPPPLRWAAATGPVRLWGSAAPGLAHAARLRALAPGTPLHIVVTLRLRDEAGLDRLLQRLSDPVSPSFHAYLTPAQFRARFAPTPRQQARVQAWLRRQGLIVTSASANGLQVSAVGSAAHLSRAFHTSLWHYRQGDRSFDANRGPLSLPAALSGIVGGVAGLDSRSVEVNAGFQVGHRAPGGGPDGGYTPGEVAQLYDLAPLQGRGLNGQGQTVAILTHSDYSDADLRQFNQEYNLDPTLPTRVAVDGGAALDPESQAESEMDAEIVHEIAPRASILEYLADNSAAGTIAMYNRVVSERKAQVITTSWGANERALSSSQVKAIDSALKEAAAQGQTVLAASGDQGAYDEAQAPHGDPNLLEVDFPASDPWVTGVGGTTLQAGSGGLYGSEAAWSDTLREVGSGGGLSILFPRPAYQAGPGVQNQYSNTMRQVPDVAGDADPHTGFSVYTMDHAASWLVAGGTSASAPLWAGMVVLANQALGHPLGFLNPTLYALAAQPPAGASPPLHDITQGNNLYYHATPGWDFATGLGSLDGVALLTALQRLPPAPIATPIPTPAPTATPPPSQHGTAHFPAPSATPVLLHPLPALSITGVSISRGVVRGVRTVRQGARVRLAVRYTVAGGGRPTGRVIISQGKRILWQLQLHPGTAAGHPVLGTSVILRGVRGVLTLRFTLKLDTLRRTRTANLMVTS